MSAGASAIPRRPRFLVVVDFAPGEIVVTIDTLELRAG